MASLLSGTRVVQIGISQLFKVADILTLPQSVRAQEYYRVITDPAGMRRALSRRRAFKVGSLGALRPVVGIGESDDFWSLGVPDFRNPTAPTLCFIPFELALSERLASLGPIRKSRLEDAFVDPGGNIENRQVTGRLRIYPPGIGVIQLAVTLTFKEAVEVETLSRIAQNLEGLLFVDPAGRERPCEQVFLEVIEQVVRFLFHRQEGLADEDRRWHPPHVSYSFRDGRGVLADGENEPAMKALAYLMSRAPGNEESLEDLEERIHAALRLPHWQNSQVLAVAGQRVSLLSVGNVQRRSRLLTWLAESAELVSAAAYAEHGLLQDLSGLASTRQLDTSWLPGDGDRFEYLLGLCESLRKVVQAFASIRRHLERRGAGVLMAFARDVWKYGNPIPSAALEESLAYVLEWARHALAAGADEPISRLIQGAEELRKTGPLFARELSPGLHDGLEKDLLNRLQQLEHGLRGAAEDAGESAFAAALREVQKLRCRLGG
jgi:hypothetical protein